MKIAIMGAGISGLSCALEFKRHGFEPTIFEKRTHVGEPSGYSSIWLRLIPDTVIDQFAYFRLKYDLDLVPLSFLKEIKILSPKKVITIQGKLGYTVKRGVESYSLENQIKEKADFNILHDHFMEIQDIMNDFDYVIVATANSTIAKSFGLWTDTFGAYSRVAAVLGDFDKSKTQVWLNTEYSKNGFAYLIPNSNKEATLTLIVNGITHGELDYYWKQFLSIENIYFKILETSDLENSCGRLSSLKTGNIYFVGNAAGLTDDFIGCGGFNAVESGILAARSILHKLDYNKLMESSVTNIAKLHEVRKLYNTFENKDLDAFVSFIGTPGIKQLIYNNPFAKLKFASPLTKLVKRGLLQN